ncbi:SDR family NAD(P)-dependent oxidoreductase [Hutsoniella sourekii]
MTLILVTGGASGIGAGCVNRFLDLGHEVINLDIHHHQVERSGEHQVTLDLSQPEAVTSAIEAIIDHYGTPQVTINSAGISRMDFAVDSQLKDWQDTFNINVYSLFLISQAIARALKHEGQPGRIIQLASQAGKNGYQAMVSYVASKHAVIGITKTMAKELALDGILVNAVCPGIVETPMKRRERIEGGHLRGLTAAAIEAEDQSQVPLGRTASVADVVNVIEFLASDKASYMTGQAINVTGGMTMH